MASNAEVVFTGSAQQLLAEYEKLKQADSKRETSLQQLAGKSRTAAQEERARLREAKAAIEATLTPQERYNRNVERLNELHGRGLLTREQLTRSLQRERELLDATGKSAKDAGGAMEFAAGGIERIVTGITTSVGVVALATAAWQKYTDSLHGVREAQERLAGQRARDIVGGGLGPAQQAQFLAANADVLPEQALAALRGVQQATPLLDDARKQQLARQAALLGPALAPADAEGKVGDVAQLEQFARTMATLADAFPGKSPEELANLALTVQRKSGANIAALEAGQFERGIDQLVGQGQRPEQALATLLTALDKGFSTRHLLDEGVLSQLPQETIQRLEQDLIAGQQQQAARQLVTDVAAVNPQAFSAQQTALVNRQGLAREAESDRLLDALQARRYAEAGPAGKVLATVQEGFEELGVAAARPFGFTFEDLNPAAAQEQRQFEQQQAQRMADELSRNTAAAREQTKALQDLGANLRVALKPPVTELSRSN